MPELAVLTHFSPPAHWKSRRSETVIMVSRLMPGTQLVFSGHLKAVTLPPRPSGSVSRLTGRHCGTGDNGLQCTALSLRPQWTSAGQ